MIAVATLCGLREGAIESVIFVPGALQNAVDAPRGRGRVAVTSPWCFRANANAYRGVLEAIMCVPSACTRRPRGAL